MPTQQRIGVFGGSFDPIHVGHLIAAEILQHELQLRQVIFLPAGKPPHKPSRVLASDEDRVAMLELAIADTPSFSISMVDLERPGYSYTSKSLEILRNNLTESAELFFLMGQDSLRSFPQWHRPDLIARQVRLGVAQRPGFEVSIDELKRAVPEIDGRIELVPIPLIGISSSDIRERVRNNEPYYYQVLPSVADYIRRHGLYRGDESHAQDPNPAPKDKLTPGRRQT